MFCDLANSTRLSRRLDPEDLGDLFQAFRRACRAAIVGQGGYLANLLGDGLLAYFGYPQSYEDAAARAATAALEILAKPPRIRLAATEVAVGVRIGLHTGIALVGDIGPPEERELAGIVGETPNVAARLQSIAQEGSIVMSRQTRDLLGPAFVCERLPARQLKGIGRSIEAWRLTGRTSHADPPRRLAARFVGRGQEMAQIEREWQRALDGLGRAVVLMGEPGIGKSCLIAEFLRRHAQWSERTLFFSCHAQFQDTEFHPFRLYLQAEETDVLAGPDATRRHRLLAALDPAGQDVQPSDDEPPGTPVQRRRRLLTDLLHWLAGNEAQPQLIVVEDLHWADSSTLEVLSLLVARLHQTPCMILVSERPGLARPWMLDSHARLIDLHPLSSSDARKLARALSGDQRVPAHLLQDLLARTAGNPLFIEEFVKSLGSRTPGQDTLALPMTLRDSLTSRLDRLGEGRRVLQVAAVFGHHFSESGLSAILSATTGSVPDAIETDLAQLVGEGLVVPDGGGGRTYAFRHALIREVAYETLLRRERQKIHAAIAALLLEASKASSEPETLAFHLEQAGRLAEAVPFYVKAGERAAHRSANAEAIARLERALVLLDALPSDAERQEQEHAIRSALLAPLISQHGWSAAQVETNLRRIRRLADNPRKPDRQFDALRGLFNVHLLRGELRKAELTAARLVDQAARDQERTGSPDSLVEALRTRGVVAFFQGDFERSGRDLAEVLRLYQPQRHRAHAFLHGTEPATICHCYLAWTAALGGDPSAAGEHSAAALEAARAADHPFSRAYALCFAASAAYDCRQFAEAGALAREADTLAEDYGFPYWTAWAQMLKGAAEVLVSCNHAGVATFEAGERAYRATGSRLILPYILGLRADLYDRLGDVAKARKAALAAVEEMNGSGARFYSASVHRRLEQSASAGRA